MTDDKIFTSSSDEDLAKYEPNANTFNHDTEDDECQVFGTEWISPDTVKIYRSQGISAFDVGAYLLKKTKSISTMKLQKLLYYCQAWSLVWDEQPLFNNKIEAWTNGPVIRELFNFHRGSYIIDNIPIGNADLLNGSQKETCDSVIKFYGDKSAKWLIDLTHMEEPWKIARKDLDITERGHNIISLESMQSHYSSI